MPNRNCTIASLETFQLQSGVLSNDKVKGKIIPGRSGYFPVCILLGWPSSKQAGVVQK
jgi:hypothetical protein